VDTKLASQDTAMASERMSSFPGLRTNEAPPAGIPPSEWSTATPRIRELLLAAAAARGSDHASDWFSARAEMAQEVPLESYDEHDDERNMLIVEGEGDQTDPLERET
jgi:hypothetical protein